MMAYLCVDRKPGRTSERERQPSGHGKGKAVSNATITHDVRGYAVHAGRSNR
jgi:hypothetical protein